MWVVHLMLTLAALYSVIIAGMYFAQTWLLFPTMFAGAARIQLPASTQRLEVWTPDGESLAGVRLPSRSDGRSRADAAWLRRERLERRSDGPHPACALSSTQCRTFHYRGYAQSSGWPSAQTLFSDSVIIFDRLLQTQAGERIIPIGFSIGAAVAAYLARHRPVTGMILVTPFDSLEAVARDLYWWAPRRAAPPQSHAHDSSSSAAPSCPPP